MRRALFALAVALLAAGCGSRSSAPDKAGGRAGPVVLSLANTSPSLHDVPDVNDFVRRVRVLSHGAMRIELRDQWGGVAPDSELQLVRAVEAGKADLGWVGSRAFDELGVRSLRALSAPMLVDSYPLEAAVFRSGLPTRMLSGLTRLHLTGVGILGDTLRRPIGVHGAFVTPSAWRGRAFGTYMSRTQDSAIRALGAQPVHAFGFYRLHDLQAGVIQGFELDIFRYNRNQLWPNARFVAANVFLWPQVEVLLANTGRLDSLTGQERTWLREAADAAAAESIATASRDGEEVRIACAHGARFVTARTSELAALRRAFAPVYRQLDRDAGTRRYIRQIERLKRGLGSQPAASSPIPAGCRA